MNLKAGENERTDYRCMLMLKNKLASMMLSVNQTLCFSPTRLLLLIFQSRCW